MFPQSGPFFANFAAYKVSSTVKPSPSCTSVAAGTKDTPAAHPPNNNEVLFRDSCGLTNKTVEACPYLCGEVSPPEDLKICSNVDQTRAGFSSRFVCKKCLPICPVVKDDKYLEWDKDYSNKGY